MYFQPGKRNFCEKSGSAGMLDAGVALDRCQRAVAFVAGIHCRCLQPLWAKMDFEGFLGLVLVLVLVKDDTWSDLYKDW